MASDYITLQNRIADELGGRSDLTSQIKLAILTAIKKWERKRFYFNEVIVQNAFNTVAAQEYYTSSDYAGIATMAKIDLLTCYYYGRKFTLAPRTWAFLQGIAVNPSWSSLPTDWAYQAQAIRLYPIPNGSFPITIEGTQRFTTLSNDTDSNAWTTDAEALIRAEAKMDLYANVLKSPDQAAIQKQLIYGDGIYGGYLQDLKAESSQRKAPSPIRASEF